MLGSPRLADSEIAARQDPLQATKDATSLASFSTTGSSAVASYSELPEQLGIATASRSGLVVGQGDSFDHPIMVQSTSFVECTDYGGLTRPNLDSRSSEGVGDASNVDAVTQSLLPTYSWPLVERKPGSELKQDELGALEALDDYLASPQVTECTLPKSDDTLTKGRCLLVSSTPVSREELENWVQQVHGQLNEIMDVTSAKLSQCRARMAEKDEVIKRLHWRLQSYECQSGQLLSGGGGTNPRTPQRRGTRGSVGGAPAAGIARGIDAPCSPTGVTGSRATRASLEGSSASSSVAAVPARAGSPLAGAQGRALRAARDNPQRDVREQTREKGDQSQMGYLRQEVAQLRRRNSELVAQVRQRETQMDGLTNMIKEMQVTAQRQSGLFKRQLHLRDDTLLQMQEELLATRTTTTSTPPGSVSSTAPPGAPRQAELDASANRGAAQMNGVVSGTGGAVSSTTRRTQPGDLGATSPSLSKSATGATQAQALRPARRPTESGGSASERGSSAARSLSAFARHKDRQQTRRSGDRSDEPPQQPRQRIEPRIVGSMAQTLPATAGQANSAASNSVFSPRGRPGKVTAAPLGNGNAVVGAAMGIAQAAHNAIVQSASHLAHQQSSSAEAPPAGGTRGGPRGSFRGSGSGIVSGPNAVLWNSGPGSQSAMNRASSADARSRGSTRGVIVRRANRRQ